MKSMKNYLSLLLLVLISLSGCRATATTSNSLQSDTTLQEFTHLIPALEVPEINLAEGQELKLSTPEGNISFTRAGNYLAYQGATQVIKHKQIKTVQVPVKIKDKSRVTIHQNSHNSDKSKVKSKTKTELEVNENSNNRHKEKKSDPMPLLFILFIVAVVIYLLIRFKKSIPFIRHL